MYFDPGTGSMVIQALLGAIPVIGAFFVGIKKKNKKKKDDVVHDNSVKVEDGFEVIDND